MAWEAAWRFARSNWHWLAIAGLVAALALTRGALVDAKQTLALERAQHQTAIAKADTAKARDEARYATQQATAAESYAERIATREPLILRSTDTVREYAQTAAGAQRCLSADRVLGIRQFEHELFAEDPPGAEGRDGALLTGAVPDAAGR